MSPGNNYGTVYIKIKASTETSSLQYISKTFRNLFPLNPFVYSFKREQNEQSYAEEAKWKQIILFSAVLTVFISCIGLFGLSVLSAEKRTKEIGVRKVLGASVTNIVNLLSKDFLRLVGIAVIIASPIAYFSMHKWLQDFAYRIPISWWIFVIAAVTATLIAILTVSFQAIKAAVSNPVKSLRTE